MHTIRKATFVFGMVVAASTMAANVAIDESPLEGGISSTVRSNIMFVLDDSGSMESAYIPDGVDTSENRYAFRSSHCNGMAYDPSEPYDPPMRSDGTSLPNARFASAWEDGFAAENLTTTNSTSSRTVGIGSLTFNISSSSGFSTTVGQLVQITRKTDRNIWMVGTITAWASPNLTVNVTSINGAGTYNSWNITNLRNLGVSGGGYTNRYFTYSGGEPLLGYAYNPSTGAMLVNPFRTECNSNVGTLPAIFAQVTMTPASADAQKYANWYSYYRFRRNSMKTAMTLAFGKMANPERFRVGLSTINYTGTSNADARYLDVDDYCDAATNCTHRQNFVGKLLGIPGTNSATPLRGALSKAGRIYGGLLVTGTRDPVQYSCQKNFAILSTDGYWNEGSPAGRSVTGVLNLGDQDSVARTDYKAYNNPYVPTAMDEPMIDGSNAGAGTPDVLADVAMYYYKTVIRSTAFGNCTSGSTGENLCPDPGNVPVSVRGGVADKERWDCNRFQHMNTYTIGLGVRGTLNSEFYLTGGSLDYAGLKAGTIQWPAISNNNPTGVDDLWHAAVNGRGEYYSANSPAGIVSSLNKALAAIGASTGTASAAGSSSQQLRAGDNAYLSRYDSQDWFGDIQALRLDPATGALVSTPSTPQAACDASATTVSNPVWSAQEELDDKLEASPDSSSRKIYVASGGSLADFTTANVSNTDFDPTTLSQYTGFSASEKLQATKASLVAYLRGVSKDVVAVGPPPVKCCEDQAGNTYRLYRDRSHVLGDIVNSTPYFSGKSPFSYGDAGFISYRDSTTSTRRRILFAGANDGMLHAFDAGVPPDTDGSGEELWAFIPSAVLPKLSKLADFNYNANHRFFVNGDMNIGDVADGAGNWKTLLVGGLGAGGRDYYALDVTNPNAPVLLWEFRARNPAHADNMGLSYGAPQITKRKSDGKWVVLVSSGYNNTSPGDGRGRLYVVDALSGIVLQEMLTASPADPSRSGIGGVSGWVDATMTNNETQYVYAGDLDGKLWRFDIVANSVTQLAEFADGGTVQPITRRPELGEVTMGSIKNRWVFVATGKALAETDIDPSLPSNTATTMQSFYAVRDDGINTYGGTSFRSVPGVVEMNLTGAATTRIMNYVPAGTSAPGWYFDFDVVSGEKVNTDVTLQIGWLTFGTRVPKPSAGVCERKVDGFQYFIEYNPQSTRPSETWEITWLEGSGASGVSVIQTSTGETVVAVTDDQGNIKIIENKGDHSMEKVRRVSWRELPH